MTERDEIVERYQRLRDNPMTPQYLTAPGQSGSLLDYQEAEELGKLSCRNGHRHLGKPHTDVHKNFKRGPYRFCSTCGHRVCAVCEKDVGGLIASWDAHARTHDGVEGWDGK